MFKDIKFFLQKIFIDEHIILKKRILKSIQNKIEKEYFLIPELCNKNLPSIDIGVFRGVYSYLLSQNSQFVVGFEANPIMYSYIKKNLTKIIKNIELHNIALSNAIGNTVLKIPYRKKSLFKRNFEDYYEGGLATIHQDNNLENKNFESFNIKCNMLNNFNFNKKVGFIKIDTEGHEQSVLEGATNVLSKDKPNLLIEIEQKHRGNNAKDTFYFLKQFGYAAYVFDKDKLINVTNLVGDRSTNNYIFKI